MAERRGNRPPTATLVALLIASAGIMVAVAVLAMRVQPPADPAAVEHDAGTLAVVADARTTAAPTRDAGDGFAALASFPRTQAARVISLPIRADEPRFDVGGPALVGAIAAVSSSQFGFLGVDWRAGAVAWSKPAGSRVAPPLARAGGFVLIGDCLAPPAVPERDALLGCLRSVTVAGADQLYVAIHGDAAALAPFALAAGAQKLWWTSDTALTWRRGDRAVSVDVLTGVAKPLASADDPPLTVAYRGKRWDIARGSDGSIDARGAGGSAAPWHTDRAYTVLGAVYIPDEAPMVRAIRVGHFGGRSEMTLFDIDATGSLHGQVAFPVPALSVLGFAASSVGDVAIALRLDTSLRHDYVVGYAASSLLMYVYPLPDIERADPVGVAVAPDAVIVFHDGDTLTVLPELSSPPSAPGAALAPVEEGD